MGQGENWRTKLLEGHRDIFQKLRNLCWSMCGQFKFMFIHVHPFFIHFSSMFISPSTSHHRQKQKLKPKSLNDMPKSGSRQRKHLRETVWQTWSQKVQPFADLNGLSLFKVNYSNPIMIVGTRWKKCYVWQEFVLSYSKRVLSAFLGQILTPGKSEFAGANPVGACPRAPATRRIGTFGMPSWCHYCRWLKSCTSW